MNFQVPQFIEVEDKIFGPLSFRQFLYIVGGAGLGYIFFNFTFLPAPIRLIPALLALAFGLALAFYKVNNRPLIYALEAAFWYYTHSRLYLWKKSAQKSKPTAAIKTAETASPNLEKLSGSRLKDLSWSLDVNEKVR
jgi:hypothetical protein